MYMYRGPKDSWGRLQQAPMTLSAGGAGVENKCMNILYCIQYRANEQSTT